jgi:hypothetical protein
MKQSIFNALTVINTVADALLLGDGTNFLFNDTRVRTGNHGGGYGNHVDSQSLTALRHKIHYYRRDTSTSIGYVQVFDILESDILTQESKTPTRVGKNRAVNRTRDDDTSKDIISDPDWS